MEATKKSYPTDLTDSQWELVKDLIPAAGKGGRKRTVDIVELYSMAFSTSTPQDVRGECYPTIFRQWFRVMSKKKHCNICRMELVVKDKLWLKISV